MGFAEDYIRGHQAGTAIMNQQQDIEDKKATRASQAEILKHTLAKMQADEKIRAITDPIAMDQARLDFAKNVAGTNAPAPARTADLSSGPITVPSAAEATTAATTTAVDRARQLQALKDIKVDPMVASLTGAEPGSTISPEVLTAASHLKATKMAGESAANVARINAQAKTDVAAGKPEKLIKVEHQDPETGRSVVSWLPQSAVAGQSFAKPTSAAMESRLASAQSAAQVGNSIIAKLKDPNVAAQIGPAMGKFNTLRDFLGNPPPEFSDLAGNIESYALANMGVHGMRSAQGAEKIKSMLDAKHTPESLAATIQGLNEFSNNLLRNEGRKGAGAGTGGASGSASGSGAAVAAPGGPVKIGDFTVVQH